MGTVKDKLLKAFRAVKNEYTRVDLTCNNCGRENFGGESVGEKLFCPDCFAHLPFNRGNICAHCGRSAVDSVDICNDCAGVEWEFEVARSIFSYSPPVDGLIRDLKYKNKRYLAEVFGVFLAEGFYKYFAGADVITFAPMTKKSLKTRKFNQAQLLAAYLSHNVGVPCEDLLEKTVHTERQARLGRNDRLVNLKGTMRVRKDRSVFGKTVLFVDDVLTTGATAQTAAAALKKAGAEWVFVLTVASVTDRQVARILGQELPSSAPKIEKKPFAFLKRKRKDGGEGK